MGGYVVDLRGGGTSFGVFVKVLCECILDVAQ